MAEAYSHTNRRGVTYYLHRRLDGRGRDRFVFAREVGEGALAAVPAGYEVRETPNGTVSIAEAKAKAIRPAEERTVRDALPREVRVLDLGGLGKTGYRYEVEVRGKTIVVHEGVSSGVDFFAGTVALGRPRFGPVLKFELVDAEQRSFEVRRMTWRGEGGWSYPLGHGALPKLVQATMPRLGQQSFFDLM